MYSSVIALLAIVPALAADNAFNAEYYADPWTGVCATGEMQTPIDLPVDCGSLPGVPRDLVTEVKMPVITAPVEKNVGSAIQVRPRPFQEHVPHHSSCSLMSPYKCSDTAIELPELSDRIYFLEIVMCSPSAVTIDRGVFASWCASPRDRHLAVISRY